jgi:hypothetical protein
MTLGSPNATSPGSVVCWGAVKGQSGVRTGFTVEPGERSKGLEVDAVSAAEGPIEIVGGGIENRCICFDANDSSLRTHMSCRSGCWSAWMRRSSSSISSSLLRGYQSKISSTVAEELTVFRFEITGYVGR